MATGTVFLDVDDEITSAAARIRGSEATKVALVVPYGSRIATSRMNFRLLSREAVVNNRRLSIVATDPATRALAASAGLPVFASVAEWDAVAAGTAGATASDDGMPPPSTSVGDSVAAPTAATAAAPAPPGPAAALAPETTSPPGPTTASTRRNAAKSPAPEQATLPLGPAPAPTMAVVGPAVPRLPPPKPSPAASALPSAPSRITFGRGRSLPAIGGPALIAAAAAVFLLVVAAVGAFLFLPSAEIVVTPRPEGIGPIALVVRADPDITSPNATENLVPAQRLEVPVSASDTFPATDKRVEQEPATGKVVFQSLNTGSENTIPKGSFVSTEGGISFQTTATLTLARAKVFPQFEPSTGTVGVVAVKSGTAGNVPANAITVVPKNEDPTLTKVWNPNATAGGTHQEFPRIGQEDVDGAVVALQAKLTDDFEAALADGAGAPANATVFAETAQLGDSTPTVDLAALVGKEVESFDLGLEASGTVIAVDASPVMKIAEARLLSNVGADHRLVEGSVEIVPGDPTVTGGEVSFPVTAKATRVPILDPAKLLALVKGRTVDEARSILAQFGDVVITPWPEWVTTIPGIESRVTIEIVGQTDRPSDGSSSPSESARPSTTPRPTQTAKPSNAAEPSASGLPVASPAP